MHERLRESAYQKGLSKGLRFMTALIKLWLNAVEGPVKRRNRQLTRETKNITKNVDAQKEQAYWN